MRTTKTTVALAVVALATAARAQLTVTETDFHGKKCFEVVTPWATLYFEDNYGSSGFKGVVDNEGNDWLQAGYGWGSSQGYRGFPNATDGDFGHAQRNSNSTNTVTKQDFDHIIINSYNASMEFNYHFFPSHGAIEVLKAEDKYCFLWEGTNGGSVEEEDFFVTSDGERRHARTERNTVGDFPDEWMYFGDPNREVMFLHGKRPDDNINDENWRRFSTFELYSFGRGDKNDGWRRRLEGTDNYYVYTFIDKNTTHAEIEQLIENLFANPYQPLEAVTGVRIRKSATKIPLNGTLTVTAARYPKEGAVTWSALDGAAVQALDDTSAVVTAPGTAGTIRVVATFMETADTLTLEVYDPARIHLKLNAGGPDVQDWVAAAPYIENGKQYTFSFDTDISQAVDPAPPEVYKTVHHFDHTYNIDVDDGQYRVRIHFVNNGDGRLMNYAIEGQTVLTDYTVTEDAGGSEIAVVKEFDVTVSDGNGLQIEATKGSGNDVFEAGVEVIATSVDTRLSRQSVRFGRGRTLAVRYDAGTIAVSAVGWGSPLVKLISLDGRVVASRRARAGTVRMAAPSPGTYLVDVDGYEVRAIHVK